MKGRKIISLPGITLFLIFLALGFLLLAFYDKGDILLIFNRNHTPLADLFFKYWTYLGDGWFFLIVLIFFLLKSYYFALLTALSVVVQTVFVQGLKHIIFDGMVRPILFFDNLLDLHTVQGVDIHRYNTFPSGHTATSFTIAMLLSLFVKGKYASILFFICAILVGISRVYLIQHFFIDIYFGAIFGVLSVMISYWILEKKGLRFRSPWNRSLLTR